MGHALPTEFDKFIESNKPIFEEKYSVLRDEENSWNNVESRYGDLLCDVMEKREEFYIIEEVDSIIQSYGFNEYGEIDYFNYKSDAFDEENRKISYYIKLLKDFESDFHDYLKEKCSVEEIAKCRKYDAIQKIISSSSAIVTFNYTYTPEILYGAKNVVHIHGDIDSTIAIGCGSLESAKETAIDDRYPTMDMFDKNKYGLQEMMAYYEDDMDGGLVENTFIKRFFDEVTYEVKKRQQETFNLIDEKSKDALILRQNLIKRIKKEQYDEVYILGHSLGLADINFFKAIYPKSQFFYFYHGDKDSLGNKGTREAVENLGWNCKWISTKKLYV